jgi:hypothetical protein
VRGGQGGKSLRLAGRRHYRVARRQRSLGDRLAEAGGRASDEPDPVGRAFGIHPSLHVAGIPPV